jgi:hypothetical protein
MTTLATPRAPAPAQPKFKLSSGITSASHATLLYGTGGIGKSTLASLAPGALIIDLALETDELNIRRVTGINTWNDLRAFVRDGDFSDVQTLVIDNGTAAEELCRQHVIAYVKGGKNQTINSIEDYGYGKGGTFLVEEWRKLLGDLDVHRRANRNVVLIAHERIGKVPNPSGEDFIRYEPRLYSDKNASVMHVTKEWCNHVLFISYDVVASDGKAKGSGTRTIYSAETATFMAKSRTLDSTPIPFQRGDGSVWNKLIKRATDVAPEL